MGKSDNDKWSNATILLKAPFSFVILYLCESICSFHQVGVEVPIVLQISPQMFSVTPTFTFNRVNKIFCVGFASTASLKYFYHEVCTRHMEMGHLEGSVLITFTSSVFIQRYKRGE